MRPLIAASLLALSLAPSMAALPKHEREPPKAEEHLPLDPEWEARYVLYQYYCPLYQQERRIRWVIRMPPEQAAEFQRWPRRKQDSWWRYVSHVVGCDF